MNEDDFESHIATTLEKSGWVQNHFVACHPDYINGVELASYLNKVREREPALQKLSQETLLKTVLGLLTKKWEEGTKTAILFKQGLQLVDIAYRLNLLDAKTPGNNIFSFQTQYQHDPSNQDRKIDLMLWVNGIPFTLIEIKNQQTGQTARDAIEQLIHRSVENQCPKLFQHAVFSAGLDTNKVYVSLNDNPKNERDFRNFDPTQETYETPKDEFPTQHFYKDFLNPKNVVELLNDFIYEETKDSAKSLIFPRFHQWEAVRYLCKEIQETSKDKILGERYLLQHSPGSGKSKTIAWLCKHFKSLFIPDTEEAIFHKVLVITDRKDLDDQLQRDLIPLIGEHAVTKATSKKHLGELLANSLPPIVTSTVQKFLDFDKTLWPKDKRIAIIIDEAHRSQEGEYNEKMRAALEAKPVVAEDCVYLGDQISDIIDGTNAVLVALTATPTSSTLERFGRDGKPHHLYSMSQAIEEKYIINVVKNVITYDTLYQLHQTGTNLSFLNSYPPSFLNRTLTWAAYESEDIIEEKAKIIAAMIRSKTIHAINGRGRAMLTCISRKAAALYQEKLQKLLKEYDIAPLVSYTDGGDIEKVQHLNYNVGAVAHTDEELKTLFRSEDKYRILVVASKFQTGFDETLLHTLFLDKPVKGINAVQTLSRLNRTHPGKEDTLIVDFTNSFEEIAKAFGQFLGQSETVSTATYSEADLIEAFNALKKKTKTKDSDWTPKDDEGKPVNLVEIDKTCSALAKKIKDAKKELSTTFELICYFNGKGLFCDNLDWAIRKDIIKGVLGYFSNSTGKYSVDDLRESVTAIGLATKLIHIGNREISPTTPKKGSSGGGGEAPKEVTMAEAIAKINQNNLLKLQEYIQAIKASITEFYENHPKEVVNILEEFEKKIIGTIDTFIESEDIVEMVEKQNPEEYDEALLEIIKAGKNADILKRIIELIQTRQQLGKIECRFYNGQSEFREGMNKHLEENLKIQENITKIAVLSQLDKKENPSETSLPPTRKNEVKKTLP